MSNYNQQSLCDDEITKREQFKDETTSMTIINTRETDRKNLDIFHSTPTPSLSSSSSSKKRKKKSKNSDVDDGDDDQSNDGEEDDDDDEPTWFMNNSIFYMINHKDSLLRLQCDLYGGHKWNSFIQLTDALIADRRFNCYIIMKNFLFTLYQWPPNHLSNIDNFQLVHQFIWKILFLLDERYETMIELINYFIYVGDYHQQTSLLTQAKSLLHDLYEESERRYRKGSRKEILKSFRMLEIIYRIYMEYLDLIEWKNNGQISASASAIRVDKLKTNFTDLMDHFADDPIPELNLDIIPLTILELSIDHLNDTDEAFETLLKYSKTFPDNLNGHVFLYEFMKKFNYLNVDSNVPIDCLRNIERLCPDSKYVLRLARHIIDDDPIECLEMICNFLDYKSNYNSLKAWKLLHQILSNLFNTTTIINDQLLQQIRQFLFIKLKYWQHIHFRLDKLNRFLSELRRQNNPDHTTMDDHLSDSNFDNDNDNQSTDRDLYKYKGKIIAEIHGKFPDLINCDYTHLLFLKIKTQNL